tara:strand:+ start:113 stop:346 length:234 start_codon:yes stop_codon:yes gene_type:complete
MVNSLLALVLFAVGMVYLYLWISQLVQLMTLSCDDFPGRHDKILWVIIYIVFFPLAPFIFVWWKQAYLHMHQLKQKH